MRITMNHELIWRRNTGQRNRIIFYPPI